MGGLSKKIFQIKSLSKHTSNDTLLLDSGNLLFKRKRITSGSNQERLTAESIIEIYHDIGYDAVGVGPLDLVGGLDFIQQSSSKGFPWVSANVMDSHGKPVFRQWIDTQLGNTRVVISALTAAPAAPLKNIKILPWEQAIPEFLAHLKKDADTLFVILLSTLSNEENQRIAELFPGISLLIGADMRKENISPELFNSSLLTQTGKQGKYQGLLEINFGQQRQWGQNSAGELADLQNKLGSLNWQLRRLETKAGRDGNDAKNNATIIRLKSDKQGLNKQISSLKETITREMTEGPINDQYNYRFIGLSKKMPDDPATTETLKALNLAIRKHNTQTKARVKKEHNSTTLPPDYNIVGYGVCEACHVPQADFWQGTRHASAYETLFNKKKHLDLECLPCHVTLDTRNTALNHFPLERLLSFPPELQSVGCESCHGSGKKHSINPEQFKVIRVPEKEICLTCHTTDHDDSFEYNMDLPKISCPAEYIDQSIQ